MQSLGRAAPRSEVVAALPSEDEAGFAERVAAICAAFAESLAPAAPA